MTKVEMSASQLVENLLAEHPYPDASHWKALVDAYPEHASEFVDAAINCMQVDAGVYEALEEPVDKAKSVETVSYAIGLAQVAAAERLAETEAKLSAAKGPAAKTLAQDIGVGEVQLMNWILTGAVKTPSRLLLALSQKLDVGLAALQECFLRSFAASYVPAFKSGDTQPTVALEPQSWENAVRSLRLAPDETKRLLEFSDNQ